jgi:hypothetical protein
VTDLSVSGRYNRKKHTPDLCVPIFKETIMQRDKVVIEVTCNIDPVIGWGNDPQDFVKHIELQLNRTIPHYNPVVRLLRVEKPTEDPVLPAGETERSGP